MKWTKAWGDLRRSVQGVFGALVMVGLLAGFSLGEATHAGQPVARLAVTSSLFLVGPETFPAAAQDVAAWQRSLTPVKQVRLTGGAYWLVSEVRNPSDQAAWVFNPHGTLIKQVEARVYRSSGPTERLITGYQAHHPYMLHYGQDLTVVPGERVWVVTRFSSPYFASLPDFSFEPQVIYRQQVALENLLALGAFGALLALTLYNLFVYAGTRNLSFLYYAAYTLTYGVAWALTFHVPADVFDLHDLRLHYVGFFLLPVFNTLFYLHFLRMDERLPRLARFSRVNLWLPLALLPSCFFLLPYAHILATGVISLWLLLALSCGVVSWRSGFQPARFFVLAILALLVPASLILPANVGLMPDPVANSELLTLLGGTLDGILLAFALADQIRLLIRENGTHIEQLQRALHLAGTDSLTGLRNRHAFEQAYRARGSAPFVLILIDLDGLKQVNDHQGHTRGDELLRTFARLLRTLEDQNIHAFRLGGDEFILLAPSAAAEGLQFQLNGLERTLRESFPAVGLSFGLAHAGPNPAQTFEEADQQMYRHKNAKRSCQSAAPEPTGPESA
ncbi:7TM diverse intracellular signaling domain-containing protein [Deinococcus navajonensis]|uniref:7TM diverse intracellular signaling domain-containing protein n=1 Tax=Deinococcus navajonensis TaxID=309884 RepID=A0ABV8XLS4_9DEIO